jgi:DNA helicase-2/ATP-dependent DNA helicase PcrA
LAGGRFRLGVTDLYALSKTAKMLQRGHLKAAPDQEPEDVIAPAVSLGEALDFLRTKPEGDRAFERFSEGAVPRLVEAAQLIAERRRFLHDDIIDQILGWEKAVGLDIETLAHPDRGDSRKARSALLEAAANYQASADQPSAVGFLDWLREAEWRDNLQPQTEEAEPGCVQVLTIHGSKGLEWDFVALPRMVDQELPSVSRDGTKGWLGRGELPYPLRGDLDHLPHFSWQQAETRKEVKDLADEFFAEVAAWQLTEERRLVYVAVTRAKRDLGLFGSWWATQKKPRKPSVFLRELEQVGLIEELPGSSQYEENPAGDVSDETLWPADPLGARRDVVGEAARRVREALTAMPDAIEADQAAALDEAIARAKKPVVSLRPALPFRLAASGLQGILHEPDAVMDSRKRPTPRRVFGQERQGTEFHEWVEKHFREAGHLSLAGDWGLDGELEVSDLGDMDQWREDVLASVFALSSPLAIDREIHLPLAGHVIVCKIDAVFATDLGADIIDWKTGRPPANAREEKTRSLQLSLYRLAWSEWSGVALENITAGWWFSQTGGVKRPTSLLGRAELEKALVEASRRYEVGPAKS